MECELQSRCAISDMSWAWPFVGTYLNFCLPPATVSATASHTSSDTTTQMPCQTSTQVPQLPPEILRLVQQHILCDSRHEFPPVLQVCRAWSSLGRPLLWKDVVLTQGNLESFAEAVKRSPGVAAYTQSLTVLSSRHDYLYQKSERARQWLPLIETVGSLPNLKTFSMFIRNSDGRKLIIVNNKHLNQIFQALPLTLTSLEIDLTCAMVCGKGHEHHQCATIRNMLPRLKHLRLSRGIWCHQLFDALEKSCLNLKTVLLDDSRRGYTNVCERIDPVNWRSDLIGESVAFAGRKAIDAELMPSLETFNVLTSVAHSRQAQYFAFILGHASTSLESSRADSFSSIQNKDVLNNQTTTCPIAEVSGGSWILRYPSSTFADGTGESIGNYDELIPLIESNVQMWSSSAAGSRSPNAFPKRLRSKAQPCVLEDLPFDRESNENLRPLATLQHWEKKCQRKLLYPRTHEGLERGGILYRDRYEEEAPSVPSMRPSRANSAC